MQEKLFQRCTHLLSCSALTLGGNVNTRRMSKPDKGSIFHIKKSIKYSGHRKLICELSKLSKCNAFNLLGYLTNTDASILVYKFRPEITGFNMYTINFLCIRTLSWIMLSHEVKPYTFRVVQYSNSHINFLCPEYLIDFFM